jgi:hypothetical protein
MAYTAVLETVPSRVAGSTPVRRTECVVGGMGDPICGGADEWKPRLSLRCGKPETQYPNHTLYRVRWAVVGLQIRSWLVQFQHSVHSRSSVEEHFPAKEEVEGATPSENTLSWSNGRAPAFEAGLSRFES